MAMEYKLPYTASEINEKLRKIDNLVSTVNGIPPDASGNVDIQDVRLPIIDVVELPQSNVQENMFYRLLTASFVVREEKVPNCTCYCVNALPATGEVVTDASFSYFIGYYNTADNDVYGYADEMLASAFGVPAGWYTFSMLASVAGVGFNGIITNMTDCPDNDYYAVLLEHNLYSYKNGWKAVDAISDWEVSDPNEAGYIANKPFYTEPPIINISWDGDMTDKPVMDMSLLGYDEGTYFVKVSDLVPDSEMLVNGTRSSRWFDNGEENYSEIDISMGDIDWNTYSGAYTVTNSIIVVYSVEMLNAALGLPEGAISNGVWFYRYISDSYSEYVELLKSPTIIHKINSNYLPDNVVYEADLLGYATTTSVQTMINNAIGNAIGGSY